ncbi:MAG: hypothetical protein WBO10_04445 [Pyrinomonadaceae bacterium]
MKTGGIVISVIGIALFAWHLIRVSSNPDYIGYASHQVMSVNGVIVLVFGVTFILWADGGKNEMEDPPGVEMNKRLEGGAKLELRRQ